MNGVDVITKVSTVVQQWDGVVISPFRVGGVSFRVNRREIGHLQREGMADLLFPVRVRRQLVAAGFADAHRALPKSGWVSFLVQNEFDVPAIVDLLRLNYELIRGLFPDTESAPSVRRATRYIRRLPADLIA